MDHCDSATSGSQSTEDVGPNDVLWEQTEGPAGVAAKAAAQRQAAQARAMAARPAHHKVAPNVRPTTSCATQLDGPSTSRKEECQKKSSEEPNRDEQAEPSGRAIRPKLAT